MIKIFLFILFPFILTFENSECSAQDLYTDTVRLIFDEAYVDSLPRNFRKSNGALHRSDSILPDMTGLAELNISGSAEFSDLSLKKIIDEINSSRLIVIDLRQEEHGFINGMPVSWYGKYDWANVGLTEKEILSSERRKLDSLKEEKHIQVTRLLKKDKNTNTFGELQTNEIEVKKALTEKELTQLFSYNIDYLRLTNTDHRKPSDENVDLFVKYVTSLKGEHWIHFHCHAGDGRTTTFMTMYDILKNAGRVSLQDIIKRQYLLGGIDLANDENFPDWDKQYAIERTSFLEKFYEYCQHNDDDFKTPYSEWFKSK